MSHKVTTLFWKRAYLFSLSCEILWNWVSAYCHHGFDVLMFEVTWQKNCYYHASVCSWPETRWLMPSRGGGSKLLPAKPLVSELPGWWSYGNLSSDCLVPRQHPAAHGGYAGSVLARFPPSGWYTFNYSWYGYPLSLLSCKGYSEALSPNMREAQSLFLVRV